MSRFETFIATVLDQSWREARDDGSATVEAHHLLLAIAAVREPTTHRLLTSVGLDHSTLRQALDREFEQSLAVAGVSLAAAGVRPRSATESSPQMGSSAKLVLERGLGTVHRKRDLRPAHLLLGIVQAQVGTVPRALALAGVDRAELVERVRRSLVAEGEHGGR